MKTGYQSGIANWLLMLLLVAFPALGLSQANSVGQESAKAQEQKVEQPAAQEGATAPDPQQQLVETLETLKELTRLKQQLQRDIKTLDGQIKKAQSDTEKRELVTQLDKLKSDLNAVENNFEGIAAGADISSLKSQEEKPFNLQDEVLSLLRPAIDELKDMTTQVRQKSDLKERIAYYQQRVPVIKAALQHAEALKEKSQDRSLRRALDAKVKDWEKQQAFMQSELQAAQLQLDKLVAAEVSVTEASQQYLKTFFRKRGLYLTEAFALVVVIILLSRLSHGLMQRHIPGFRKVHRSFRVRLVELVHRILTLLAAIAGPMVVFYLVEDWVLFSLSLLLLFGIAWTLRQALPRYWSQIQLFLNIGSVREGERILLDDLPWLVQKINVYCILVNPTAGLSQRVPLADMVGLKSRPLGENEPWFPCRHGDWVILNDGVRGKVVGLSQELVQLIERGGATRNYTMGDFLANSPRNLATNFRIKETLGVSYDLQRQATSEIPQKLKQYLQSRITEEGYGDALLNLVVEFAQANSSSLDIQIIADFEGELGDLYNRLRRAIQRWSVDACSEYGWEIPFPQMTLSGAVKAIEAGA